MGIKSTAFTSHFSDSFLNAIHRMRTTVQKNWDASLAVLQPIIGRVQTTVETVERKQLDPLLEKALQLWGDQRLRQRQRLITAITVSELTADERQIHRGLYVSALSFGLASAGALFFPPLRLLSLPGLLWSTWQTYQRAYVVIVEKRTIDITVFTVLINTTYIVAGYWVIGAMASTSYFFSLKLLSTIKDRFAQGLATALMQHPQSVWVLADGKESQCTLDALAEGAIVIVRAGELIPVDGRVTAGAATVNQHVLTGEAQPVEKTTGDKVMAATIVLTGRLYIAIEQAGAETTVGKLSQILAETVDFRSSRQLYVQRLTDQLILPISGLAAVTLPFLGLSSAAAVLDAHPNRHLNILGGLSLLNYLVVATEHGILIKDGHSLELLSDVDTLIFDKTGTLTQEEPDVAAIHLCSYNGQYFYSEDEVLSYAAAAEQHQSHPIARSIRGEAARRGLVLPPIDDASYYAGFGICVGVAERRVHVGSLRFMQMEEIVIPSGIDHIQEMSNRQGHTLVMVALNGCLAGILELHTTLRPEVKTVLAKLRQSTGVRSLVLISGDQTAPTRRLAEEISADEYYAEVLPTGKAELVARFQQTGRKVCFVGDGINDAVALKQADVSISLQGATMAATDTAHIILMDSNLEQLLPLFEMAKQYDATTRDTLFTILGMGAIGLAGVYGLGFDLRHTTILDQLSVALGTGIAMRSRFTQHQQEKPDPAK